MKVCVIIPAYNEAKAIANVVSGVRAKHLDVVVINDGSSDETEKLASQAGAVVLTNDPRQGKGYSLKRGFAYALDKGYDGVVAMDGDGQHAANDLEGFLTTAQKQPKSVINGTRMRDTATMPWLRRMTNRFMSWMISNVAKQRIEDTQCGYRYISADILRQLPLTANDFEIETEILLKTAKLGYPILSVPIKTIYGDEKSKIRPVRDTIRFFKYLWRETRDRKTC